MSEAEVRRTAQRAREASYLLATTPRRDKDTALRAMATALESGSAAVLEANERDVAEQERAGTSEALIDRLRLNAERVTAMAEGLRDLAELPDPVGEVVRGSVALNGIELRQVGCRSASSA